MFIKYLYKVRWGFQKSALWIDEDNLTIHFNMNLIAKVGIQNGKISMTYGTEWEEFLRQEDLGTTIQKSDSILERAGIADGKGKGKNKGKQQF